MALMSYSLLRTRSKHPLIEEVTIIMVYLARKKGEKNLLMRLHRLAERAGF